MSSNSVSNNNNNNTVNHARNLEINGAIRKIEECVTFPKEVADEGRKLVVSFLNKKIDAGICIGNNKTHLNNVAIQARQQFNNFLEDKKVTKKDNFAAVIEEEAGKIIRVERREKMIEYLVENKKGTKKTLARLEYHELEAEVKKTQKEVEIETNLPLIRKFHAGATLEGLAADDAEYLRVLHDSQDKQEAEDQKALVKKSRPNMTMEQINELDEDEFATLLETCEKEEASRKEVADAVEELMELTHIPADKQPLYKIEMKGSNKNGKVQEISVSSIVMGYSVYNLLHSYKIVTGDYNGELVFHLTTAEMDKFRDELRQSSYWAHDFKNIVRDYFDNGNKDNVENYVELGQKPISEIFKDKAGWSQTALNKLGELPANTPVLLLGVVSLNLGNHPNKAKLKEEFTQLYAQAKLVAHNKDGLKKFLENDADRSNLGMDQVQMIAPRLNKLIKFKQLVTDFTEIKDFYQALEALRTVYGKEDELDVMKEFKIWLLKGMMQSVAPIGLNPFRDIAQAVEGATSLDRLEGICFQQCIELLNRYTGIQIKNRVPPYQFTPQDIEQGLYQGNPLFQYRGARHRDVAKMLETLKQSPAYRKVLANHPQLSEGIDRFKNDFVARLNNYHNLSNTCQTWGKPPLDRAMQQLEVFAIKIVDQNRSKATDASIEKALLELVGQQGAEAAGACGGGFYGRINVTLLCLQNSEGSAIDDHLNAFKQGALDAAFERAHRNYASSHADGEKEDMSKFLQITPGASKSIDQVSANLLSHFMTLCSPSELYNSAHEFLGKKFWEINREGDDNEMYRFFELLGFGTNKDELDAKYRVNGDKNQRWQYAFFQQDLPPRLVHYLMQKNYLFTRETRNGFSIKKEGDVERKIQVAQAPVAPPANNNNQNNNNNEYEAPARDYGYFHS